MSNEMSSGLLLPYRLNVARYRSRMISLPFHLNTYRARFDSHSECLSYLPALLGCKQLELDYKSCWFLFPVHAFSPYRFPALGFGRAFPWNFHSFIFSSRVSSPVTHIEKPSAKAIHWFSPTALLTLKFVAIVLCISHGVVLMRILGGKTS